MFSTSTPAPSMFSRIAGKAAKVGAARAGVARKGFGGSNPSIGREGSGGSTSALVESLEARQMMAADLAIELGNYAPLAFYVPGETVTVPYVVRNNEPTAFTGRAVVTMTLTGGATATSAMNLSNLAADATASGAVSFTIPNGFFPRSYTPTLTLTMRNAANTADVEDNSTLDNQLTLSNNPVDVYWVFGNFGGRTNVVMRAADEDGTQFTMSMSGGGYGEFVNFAELVTPNKLVLHGVRGLSGPIAQSVNFALVPGSPGTVAGADFDYLLGVADESLGNRVTLIGTFNAPAVNFVRGFIFDADKVAVTNASSTITVGDIGPANLPFEVSTTDLAVFSGDVGAFTAGDVRISLYLQKAGVIRLNSLGRDSDQVITMAVNGGATSLTIGSPGNTADIAVRNARINLSGDVGAISIGKIDGNNADAPGYSNARIYIGGRVGPMVLGDLVLAWVESINAPTSFTARDIRDNSSIFMGRSGNLGTVATPFTARDIVRSNVTLQYPVSTFTARKWFDAGATLFRFENQNVLRANSIATMNIGVAGATTDPTNGNFDATAYIGGQQSRPTQLGTANIYGTLSGSFFVAGSVGAFTAKVVDSQLFRPNAPLRGPDPAGLLDWAPALTATGSVLSFTSGDVRSGAVWVNSVRTLNVTVTSNNRNFEVVAGFRADRDAIMNGAGRRFVLQGGGTYTAPQIRSGIIGALKLTLRTPTGGAVTGFTGRFAAGLDVLASSTSGYRSFSSLVGALNFDFDTSNNSFGTVASQGRINAMNVVGVLAGNSLGFAARDFPAARFNYGTLQSGAAGVLIPARVGAGGNTWFVSGLGIPSNTFLRVAWAT